MGEKSNTLEERNASQARVIQSQALEIKALKQELADLGIWQRFAAFLISDCNMQAEVLETQMNEMLTKEASAVKK